MSDSIGSAVPAETAQYLKVWADGISRVLSQVSSSSVAVESVAKPESRPEPADSDLNICVVLDGTLRGEMNLRIPRGVGLYWAQTFMAETPEASKEFGSEYKEALEELLRQIAGQVATGLKAQFGPCQINVQVAEAPSWSVAASSSLNGGVDSHWMAEAQVSAALMACLRPQSAAAEAPKIAQNTTARNLDLLLDVELSLKLRFGERRMLLKEILDLTSGAIVELDREIEEPVEVLLDDKLIARGEVVVVDGNFGVRLTEVASGL